MSATGYGENAMDNWEVKHNLLRVLRKLKITAQEPVKTH